MSKLIRRDPPPIRSGRRRDHASTEWHALLAKAMRNPGKWFVIEPAYDTTSGAATAAYDIKTGRNGAVPEGEWDAVARECDLYVMYLGD